MGVRTHVCSELSVSAQDKTRSADRIKAEHDEKDEGGK